MCHLLMKVCLSLSPYQNQNVSNVKLMITQETTKNFYHEEAAGSFWNILYFPSNSIPAPQLATASSFCPCSALFLHRACLPGAFWGWRQPPRTLFSPTMLCSQYHHLPVPCKYSFITRDPRDQQCSCSCPHSKEKLTFILIVGSLMPRESVWLKYPWSYCHKSPKQIPNVKVYDVPGKKEPVLSWLQDSSPWRFCF